MRFEDQVLEQRLPWMALVLPGVLVWAALVFYYFGLHRTKWRFVSVPDLLKVVKASTVVAISLLIFDYVLLAPNFYGTFLFGKITILLFWVLQIALLSGSRIVYRHFRYTRTRHRARIAGTYSDARHGSRG